MHKKRLSAVRAIALAFVGASLTTGCDEPGDAAFIADPTGAVSSASTTSVPSFEITVVPGSIAWRVNESGDVVGWTSDGQPFLFTEEGRLIVLPTSSTDPGGLARDVSDRTGGEVAVVGRGFGDDFQGLHALRWRVAVPEGTVLEVTDLGTLGFGASEARAINNLGEIVGLLDPESFSGRAFFFSEATGMVDLGLGAGIGPALAHDINAAGIVAGYDGGIAFRWSQGEGVEYLGVPPDFALSFGFSINDASEVSAAVTSANGNTEQIARHTNDAGWEILGGIGETNLGWGINNLRDVVGEGRSEVGSSPFAKGVLFTDELGVVTYLDDLLADPESEWSVMAAFDINDGRQVTGWATNTVTGERSAILLTPGDGQAPPTAPTASFDVACSGLSCDFTDTSSDADGSVTQWSWDFGDGTTSTAQHPSHTYGSAGTFGVTLTVTDDAGATGSVTQDLTVTDASDITLSVSGVERRGLKRARLRWDGAAGAEVDVYRDGALIATTTNDGSYGDRIGSNPATSFTYQICEAGTTVCSPGVILLFE